MKGFLILFALCVLGTNAIPKPIIKQERISGRIGGNVPATLSPHAVMVLVYRRELEGTGTAALGSGCIISTRHILTAAHLVQGDNINYQVGFIVGTTRRMFTTTFRVIHEDFNTEDFDSDIALIFLQGTNTFPLANIIQITTDEGMPAQGDTFTVVGFGHTSGSTGGATDPFASLQDVAGADPASCVFENFNVSATHFCAIDEQSGGLTWVCPGDNGAGLFTVGATAEENILVGIVSRVLTGCTEPQLTAYTTIGPFIEWITNLAGISVETLMASMTK
jgi:hypothetical protein